MAAGLDASPRLGRSYSVFGWTAAACASFAAAVLYVPVLAGLVTQWLTDDNAAYGAIVAAMAAMLFVQRRGRTRSLPLEGSNAGAVLIGGACACFVAGTLAADVFLVRVSLPVIALGGVLFVSGPAHVRALAGPLALSFVAIPLPSALVTQLTMPLQLMASQGAAAAL